MRELGADAATHHLALKDAVDASGADLVFACGEHMRGLYDYVPSQKQAAWAPTSTELVARRYRRT